MLENQENAIRDVVKACRAHDLVMPIIISIVSPNGSLLAIRVGAEGSSILAERFEDGGLHAPFRIMLVDQSNKAIKLTINADDSSARKLDGSAFRPM